MSKVKKQTYANIHIKSQRPFGPNAVSLCLHENVCVHTVCARDRMSGCARVRKCVCVRACMLHGICACPTKVHT